MKLPSIKNSFLLVLNWDGFESQIGIKDSFKECFSEEQHYELLLFTATKRPKENFEIVGRTHTISKSDFNILGNLKSKNLLPSEHTHFDCIILLDPLTKAQSKVIKTMKINKIVGFNSKQELVNINLNTSHNKPTEKVIFAIETLKKFSN
ncbi:MAG: hypothetical protein M9916_11455 [Crocinitomicaceae bacterium]|nr:hypothetical protein [Crocinitomicaceae bacterium]